MKIFISHVSNEGLLALVLKEWIQTIFNGRLKVFVSSDIRSITAGDIWLGNVEEALSSAKVLIVLCSPYSVTRPWVNFETGGAWVKKIPVIPICHSDQKLGNLPSPLSFFMGLDIHSSDFPVRLIENLVIRARLRIHPKLSKKRKSRMRREIASALRKIAATTPVRAARPFQDKVVTILKKIATANNEDCTCSELAKSLKMDPNDLDVYLRHLMDRRFISMKTENNGDCWYTTTKAGRKFFVLQNLPAAQTSDTKLPILAKSK